MPRTILTPRANVDNAVLRSVRSSSDWLSEYRFEQNTKYKDIDVIKMAWIVDIALHRKQKNKSLPYYLIRNKRDFLQNEKIRLPVVPLDTLDFSETGIAFKMNSAKKLSEIVDLAKQNIWRYYQIN